MSEARARPHPFEAPASTAPNMKFEFAAQHAHPRGYHHSVTAKPCDALEKRRDEQRKGAGQLGVYGGAPTPATECVPHGVCSTIRAAALRWPTVNVAVRACLSTSSGNGRDGEPNTVPRQ